MKTVNQLHPTIGQVVVVRMESFGIDMLVKDVKQSYGQIRLLVAPLNGTGEAWVDISRCSRGYTRTAEGMKLEASHG